MKTLFALTLILVTFGCGQKKATDELLSITTIDSKVKEMDNWDSAHLLVRHEIELVDKVFIEEYSQSFETIQPITIQKLDENLTIINGEFDSRYYSESEKMYLMDGKVIYTFIKGQEESCEFQYKLYFDKNETVILAQSFKKGCDVEENSTKENRWLTVEDQNEQKRLLETTFKRKSDALAKMPN